MKFSLFPLSINKFEIFHLSFIMNAERAQGYPFLSFLKPSSNLFLFAFHISPIFFLFALIYK